MFGDWGWNPARTHNQEGNFESFMAQITKETKLAVIEIGNYIPSHHIHMKTNSLQERD